MNFYVYEEINLVFRFLLWIFKKKYHVELQVCFFFHQKFIKELEKLLWNDLGNVIAMIKFT